MHPFMRVLSLLCALALMQAAGCGRGTTTASPDPEDLALKTQDGVHLTATVYAAHGPLPPGLVLVHGLGGNRHRWEPFAKRAQRAGYSCLTIDLRGHGDSTTQNGRRLTYRTFTRDNWLAARQDIDAAKRALLARGADPDNLALVGASIGANLALDYAVDNDDIQAVVLVSPGLDYQGVTTEPAIAAYGTRPVLLMSAEGDAYAAASCVTLKKAAVGLCELRSYPGAAHGTDLFATSASALEQILLWFAPIIGPH